jgi:hypothetical protein
MWTKAQDVPKESADAVLDRFDKSEPAIQRMITLQYVLDATNRLEYIEYLHEFIKRFVNTDVVKPEPYAAWRERTNRDG